MQYEVVEVYESHEFNFVLYDGEIVYDGDLEPDLIAQLVTSGVLVPEGVPLTEDDE